MEVHFKLWEQFLYYESVEVLNFVVGVRELQFDIALVYSPYL